MADKVKKTIEVDSQFNPQGIIDGLKELQKAVERMTNVDPKGFSDFEKVLNEAQGKINAMNKILSNGLTTERDVTSFKNINKEIESSLSNAVRLISALNTEGFDGMEKNIRKAMAEWMEELQEVQRTARSTFSGLIKNESGKSAIPGMTVKDARKMAESGVSIEDFFARIRDNINSTAPTEVARDMTKEIADLEKIKTTLQEQVELRELAISLIRQEQSLSEKSLKAGSNIGVSVEEISKYSLQGLQEALPTIEGQSTEAIRNILQQALSTAFSKAGNFDSLLTQFMRARAGDKSTPTMRTLFGLDANNSTKIVQELQKLFGMTSKGAYLQTNEAVKALEKQIEEQTKIIQNNEQIEAQTKEHNELLQRFSDTTDANPVAEAYKRYQYTTEAVEGAERRQEILLQENDQNLKDTTTAIKDYAEQLHNGAAAANMFAEAQKQYIDIQGDVEATFNQLISRFKYFFSIFTIFRTVSNQIKQTYSDLQNLDKAFGSIAMVTSKSVNDLWSSYSQYATIANELGQTTESAIKTSALFYQQGLETNEVLELTRSTMKLATLAGQDFETSTQQLTAALRAFHMEMSEGENVTDVYSELAAHAAADVSNIADAMSKVASIASSAGASFKNISAFLTQIIETTQESGVNAGTALKTIIARFTELKENVDDAEESFEDLDYNKIDKALKSVGINLKDSSGQIRNFDDIIIELSSIWDSLSRNQQRYIATVAAGSRQQSRFIALLEDHERLMELIEVAENSAGRSTQQFAKYADTVEFRVAKLKNTWEQFRISLLNEKTIKKFLDAAAKGLEKVTNFSWLDWIKAAAMFLLLGKTVGTSFLNGFKATALLGMQGLNWAVNLVPNAIARSSRYATQSLNQFVQTKDAKNLTPVAIKEINRFSNVKDINGNRVPLFNTLDQPISGMEDNILEIAQQILKTDRVKYEAIGATAATAISAGFTSYIMQDDPGKVFMSTFSTGLTSAALGGIQAASAAGKNISLAFEKGLSTFGWGLLISVIISGLTWFAKEISNSLKEQAEKTARANNAYYDSIKNIEELEEKQEKLRAEIVKTSDEVDKSKDAYESLAEKGDRLKALSSQIALTSEEQEEFNTLSNEIAQNYPQLVESYDAEGNAIVNLTEQYEALVKWKKESYELDQLKYNQETLLDAEYSYLTAIQEERGGEGIKRFLTEGIGREMLNPTKDYTFEWNEELQRYDLVGGASQKDNILSILSTADKATGETLRKILENNAYFSDLVDIEGEKIGQKIQEIIIDNTSAYNSFIKSLEQGIPNPEVLKRQREEAEQNFNQILDTSIEFSLSRAGIYEGIDNKNVQSLMAKYTISKTGISSELIKKEFEKEFQGKDVTDEDFQNFFLERVRNIIESTDLDTLTKDFSTDFWKSFYENFSDKNYYDQYMKVIGRSGITDAEKKLWLQETEITREGWNKRAEEISKILGIEAATHSWKGQASMKAFEGTPFANVLLKSGDTFIEKFKELDKENSILAKHFTEDLSEIYDEVGEENFLELLNNTDWSEYDVINADEFWSAVAKNLDNPDAFDQVKKVFEKYFIDSDLILDEIFEKAEEKYDEIINTELSAYEKAISSYRENGYIDASALKALRKANAPLQDIINEDYSLNENALTQWMQSRVTEIEHLDATIRKDYQNRISALESILGGEKKVTKEKALQVAFQAKLAGALTSSDYVRLQNQLTDDSKENAEILSKIIDDLKDEYDESAISKIVSGYATAANAVFAGTKDSLAKEAEEMAEKVEKANKAVEDSYQDILDKQQDLIDKQKELNEAIYGTDTYKSSLDPLYNYSTALDVLSESIDEAKESLDNLDGQNPTEILDSLFDNIHQKAAYLTAENERYRAAIGNIESTLTNELVQYLTSSGRGLSTNVEDYFQFNPILGIYEANIDAINNAKMSDQLKNFISEQISTMNDYLKNVRSNNKEIKSLQKDFTDYQKKVRDDYISIQDEVVEKLKESYQKEIDDKKEMYDALEEADNDYLDALEKAIDKQRKLRDKQDKWNELSTKEKRFSLLQRDTSGANRKETQKLQQEIQDERQSLLDETVDSVIDNLKELYETQQESREAEIEYQQSVLDNANLVVEANAIMQSWKSLDDMRAWMWEHTDGIEKMSDQAVEKLTEDWAEMFDNIQEYNALQQAKVSDIFEVTSNEIQSIVQNTTESLTTEAWRALQEVTQSIENSIKNAQDAVTNAMKALTDAQTKYNEAIKEYNELIKNFEKKDDTENTEETTETYSFTTPYETAAIREARLKAMRDVVNQYTSKQDFLNNFSSYQDDAEEVWEEYSLRAISSSSDMVKKVEMFGPSSLTSTGLTTTTTATSEKSPLAQLIEESRAIQKKKEKNFYFENYNPQQVYASGGLVDYTGPAWVDGTKRKPESFLSAEDTIRIGQAASILRDLVSYRQSGLTPSSFIPNSGDTTIQLTINVDSIATEDQVDYLIDRMKEEITDAANPTGSSVILR